MTEEVQEQVTDTPSIDQQPQDLEASEYNAWAWNDSMPGSGEAPEWLNQSKYTNVEEQAKAYTELEGRFGGFTGAPEAYMATLPADLVLPEGVSFDFDEEDPIFQAVAPVAQELNMSQDGLDRMLGAYFTAAAEEMARDQAEAADYAAEQLASIPQGQQRVNQISAWAKANLDEGQYNAFTSNVTDADSLLLFETLINKTRAAPLPMPTETQNAAYSKEDIDAMFRETDADGKNKYTTDPQFRLKVQRLMGNAQR